MYFSCISRRKIGVQSRLSSSPKTWTVPPLYVGPLLSGVSTRFDQLKVSPTSQYDLGMLSSILLFTKANTEAGPAYGEVMLVT